MSTLTDLAHEAEAAIEDVQVQERAAYHYADAMGKTLAAQRIAGETYKGTEEMSWDDLFNTPLRWLVQDLIPAESTAFLVAKRNLGKTFAYLDLALNMVVGRPWLGKRTERGRVLFVLGEGQAGFGERLRSWCAVNGVSPDDMKEHVRFVIGANLNSDVSLTKLTAIASGHKPDLIVFDTYAATSGVTSEDDAALNSTTLNRARTVYPLATALFVHHPTKSTEDSDSPVLRGSSALAGNVDTIMTMYRDTKFKPLSGEEHDYIALSTEVDHGGKSRDSRQETFHGLYLTPEGSSLALARVQAESATDPFAVVEAYLTDGMTTKEFAAAAGISDTNTTRTEARYLAKNPEVRKEPASGRHAARWYWTESI